MSPYNRNIRFRPCFRIFHTINQIEKHLEKIDEKEFISHSTINLKHTYLISVSNLRTQN